MTKLKPCPFCGGEGVMQKHVFVGYSSTWGVVCGDCWAEIKQVYSSEQEAVEAWNRRVEDERTD